jgi:hypothetical protein
MSKKRRTSDDAKTIQIKDERNGTVLTVTAWGRFNKLAGTASVTTGCATCGFHDESVSVSLKEAHRIGRLLLSLKKPATLKEMQVG